MTKPQTTQRICVVKEAVVLAAIMAVIATIIATLGAKANTTDYIVFGILGFGAWSFGMLFVYVIKKNKIAELQSDDDESTPKAKKPNSMIPEPTLVSSLPREIGVQTFPGTH